MIWDFYRFIYKLLYMLFFHFSASYTCSAVFHLLIQAFFGCGIKIILIHLLSLSHSMLVQVEYFTFFFFRVCICRREQKTLIFLLNRAIRAGWCVWHSLWENIMPYDTIVKSIYSWRIVKLLVDYIDLNFRHIFLRT